jgi:hypothetical protein
MFGERVLFNRFAHDAFALSPDEFQKSTRQLQESESEKLIVCQEKIFPIPVKGEVNYFCFAEDIEYLIKKMYFFTKEGERESERGLSVPIDFSEFLGSDDYHEPVAIKRFKEIFLHDSKVILEKVEAARRRMLVEKLEAVGESIGQNRKIARSVKRKHAHFSGVIDVFEQMLPPEKK